MGNVAQAPIRKTIRLKEKFGKWISETPLFHQLLEKGKLYLQDPDKLNNEITEFYNRATQESGKKTVVDMWHKVQLLFRMVRESLKNNYQEMPKAKVVIGIGVLLYLVLPADLVPDLMPVFGFMDDVALLGWFIKHSADEINKFSEWEKSTAVPA